MKLKKLLMKLLSTVAFANANAASRIFICATPQNTDLVQADFEALTWVEIKSIGMLGQTGKETNVLTYDTWDTTVVQKAKGMTDAGSPDLEVARLPTDPGQVLLRAAAVVGVNDSYAFKILRADGSAGNVGTVRYNRGLVLGPKVPNGRNEDFDLEVFTLAFQQQEVVVNPLSTGVAPYVTAIPAITGTATVGQVLTLGTGTWAGDATITYQYAWYANNVLIAGANAATYTLLSAQLGKRITGRITATNASGSATSTTAPTAAVS